MATEPLGGSDIQGLRAESRRSGTASASTTAVDLGHRATSSPVVGRVRRHNIRFWDTGKSRGRLAFVEKSIYSAEYQRLCGLLRQLREEADLTQVDVARRLDEPQSFVSKYESGERRLDVIELHHVTEALGLPVRAVLERFAPEWFTEST